MSMDNKNTDEVNVIQEYKKIYEECELADKVKILGNIQKYQIDMLNSTPNQTPLNNFRLTGCFYHIQQTLCPLKKRERRWDLLVFGSWGSFDQSVSAFGKINQIHCRFDVARQV